MNEINENKTLDTLHRIVVNERKRPMMHRTTNMNLVRIIDCFSIYPFTA